ncbi:hypothetical protein BHU72_01165 [Desulfuribacillus stibiiarsenatis]|uniref:Potassium channel domain-containing protein n=1 Tax=Desulfuribacillus stibiiarsenatis TaxID=1390249 RepID=A0A1E5L9T4_9FIRM|nr:ion channel [Desulfuribacillus stibiiarsenatis]OEH86901.1 hypothetical protein BHU72_01165 [Desulfuribacillus stibiiarsenatis]
MITKKNLQLLLFVTIFYINVIIYFSLLYVLFDLFNLGYIYDHYSTIEHQRQSLDIVTRSMYFSAITLFSTGYGDVTPFGLTKMIAMIQSMFGYILQASFILHFIKINFFHSRNSRGSF